MSLKPEQIAASAVTLKPVTDGNKQEELAVILNAILLE